MGALELRQVKQLGTGLAVQLPRAKANLIAKV